MERLGAFIHKLQQQYQQHASLTELEITTQLLLAELQQHKSVEVNIDKKVSVIMPLFSRTFLNDEKNDDVQTKEAKIQNASIGLKNLSEEKPSIKAHEGKQIFELNESMFDHSQSLNEQLKGDKKELGNLLHDTPIKDLRKAIGINDQYLFINELFRGDELMYERSIKTINAFNILPEAEYWIQRELKSKLGWLEDSETVQHFNHLIKRRFS